jgi:hypothetical protein
MNDFATYILWLSGLILPALIFFVGGVPRTILATCIRALLAIGGGWLFMIAYAHAAQFLSQKPVNGAALAFVRVCGWALPAGIVAVCLVVRWFVLRGTRAS